jgi:hypothetical protein
MARDKERHGFLTLWLVLMLLSHSVTAYSVATGAQAMRESMPAMPGWAVPVMLLLNVVAIACTLGLFMWQKWGFWGICGVAVVGFGVNLAIGLGLGMALIGFASVVILFIALQVGGDRKGWPQLD